MNPLPATPFESGWWSFDLGDYRPCDSTYRRFALESLPSLPEPDPTLSWLAPLSGTTGRYRDRRDPAFERELLQGVTAAARRLGLTLPESFMRLMGSPELQHRIPSCTACWFGLGQEIVPCPGSPGAYLLGFLQDQQDTVIWYLYLTPAGEHCVVAIPGDVDPFEDVEGSEDIEFDDLEDREAAGDEDREDEQTGQDEDREADREAAIREIRVCAPSFATFIYRFWLENMIWFKLHRFDTTPLTDVERRYLEHYAQQNTSGR